MRSILLGDLGSGKTTEILALVRARLAAGDAGFRLLTPTATMAEHLRNQLARAGLLVRPKTVTTIAKFVRELAPSLATAGEAETRMLVAEVLAEQRPASLTALLESKGLCDALARSMEELANAGCDSLQWQAQARTGAPLDAVLRDFGPLYAGFEEALQRRGLVLRSQQVLAAAQAAPATLPRLGIDTIYMDGFFSLTLAERELVAAAASRASVLLALPEWPGAQPTLDTLRKRGFEVRRRNPVRKQARRVQTECPDGTTMALETARRIFALHADGVPWRDIGVIVRAAEPWGPQLEAAFARLGIPCRAYFASPLTRHPVYQLLAAAIEGAASEFDHAATLPALVSPVGLAGTSVARDRFDYEVREELPGRGLDGLRQIARKISPSAEPLLAAIGVLRRFEEACAGAASPAEWTARIALLHGLVAGPAAHGALDTATLNAYRGRAAALRGFQAGLSEAARLLPDEPMDLSRFWALASPALEEVSLRPANRDREAVALLDVQEARQWELPYVFLCGLIEGEFPRVPRADCILDDEMRQRLHGWGIGVSRLSDREEQEQFLFRVALSRATGQVVLLYPARDAKGEANLPAFELQRAEATREPAHPVSVHAGEPPAQVPVAQSIESPDLRASLREKHKQQRPTAIECFLRCPYQFHARHTLDLGTPPPPPSQRLDLLLAGNILHAVVDEWHRDGGDAMAIFQRVWADTLRKEGIVEGYRTAAYQMELRRSVEEYVNEFPPRPGWQVHTEQRVRLELEEIELQGRLDRYDVGPDGDCHLFDLKYSSAGSIDRKAKKQEGGLLVQGGLYTLALESMGLRPTSFSLVGARGGLKVRPSTGEDLVQLKQTARDATVESARRIYAGTIAPDPSDTGNCDYCDFADACRISEKPAAEELAGSA